MIKLYKNLFLVCHVLHILLKNMQNKINFENFKIVFIKIKKKTLDKSVERTPLTEYNLYKINWKLDNDMFRDLKVHNFITDAIVSAKTPKEAMENVKFINYNNDDDRFMWQDERYLVCELIGRSYLSENDIISFRHT